MAKKEVECNECHAIIMPNGNTLVTNPEGIQRVLECSNPLHTLGEEE